VIGATESNNINLSWVNETSLHCKIYMHYACLKFYEYRSYKRIVIIMSSSIDCFGI